MTYLQFHLVFILPPLLLLLPAVPRAVRRFGGRAAWTLPAVAAIALVYTTPWDNYLVYRGIWWYGADRVLGTIGYVPVEEYAFFVLQPLLTGAWTYLLLLRTPARATPADSHAARAAHPRHPAHPAYAAPAARDGGFDAALAQIGDPRMTGAGAYLALAAGGALALTWPSGLYLGLILVWAAPVLAAQWFFCAGEALRRPGLFVAAVGAPTLWLWLADRIAIGGGIWSISAEATTGAHLLGLPIEEALFFLVTNLLVVQGVLLFLAPALRAERGTTAAATARGTPARAMAAVDGTP